MRISVIFLFLCIFTAFAEKTYSQDAKVNIQGQQMTIGKFIDQIESQTDYLFVYSKSELDTNEKISIKSGRKTVAQCLKEVFRDTNMKYIFENDYIVLTTREGISTATQQKRTVSGSITDERGEPIIGANVLEKGTTNGMITDIDGNFSILTADKAVLLISYIGYLGQEVAVKDQSHLYITLREDSQLLEEVVVVGYGTARKRDLTGAVSRVNATQFEIEKPQSIQDILRGKIAGLNIGISTSAKGGGSMIVRGTKSIRDTDANQNAANAPLIVVDGVIFPGGLDEINPNDIESVDLLKDASSAAVYGAKSASGVLAITTKKGKVGKPVVNLDVSMGASQLATMPEVYGADEFLEFRREVFRNENRYGAGGDKLYLFDNPNNLSNGVSLDQWLNGSTEDPTTLWLARLGLKPIEIENYKAGRSVDWRDVVFQNGLRQDYNVSLSGKKDEVIYYWSLGYNNNQGIITGDEYSTYRSRLNLEGKVTDFLTVGVNTQFSFRDESAIPADWTKILTNSPWGSYYKDDGTSIRLSPVDDTPRGATHPLHDMTYQDRLRSYTTLNANLYAKVALPFGISYQLTYAPRWQWYANYNHQSTKSDDYVTKGGGVTREQYNTAEWQIDNLLKWDKAFGEHRFDLTLLANAEKYQRWQDIINAEKFLPNDALGFHTVGSAQTKSVSSYDEYSTSDAYMARLFYSFKNRYMTTLSARRDGYSAFGRSNPRGTFTSAALAWVFSEESFVDQSWLSFGKLRLSWGTNGNRNIGRYASYAQMTTGQYLYQPIGGSATGVSTLYVNQMENAKLRWEQTENINIGLDFSLFNNKIDGSIDVYQMNTKDVLLNRRLIWVVGFPSVSSNLGEVKNRGIELSLNAEVLNYDNFKWNSSLTFSHNKNEIVHLYGDMVDILDAAGNVIGQRENDDMPNQRFIGHALDEIWDYRVLGIWKEDEAEEALKYNQRPGDFKLHDPDGNYIMENSDKEFLGYREPRFRWTWYNGFNLFKNVDVSFKIYSYMGHYGGFNHAKNKDGDPARVNAYILPFYTPENPQTEYARITSAEPVGFTVWRKRSFVRLDNISIGYNVPQQAINKFKVQKLRVYGTIQNVGFYAPEWELWDPETSSPTPRNWTLGINITL